MTGWQNPLVSGLLGVPAVLYGAAVRLRHRLYRIPALVRTPPLAVISIGNLTVGGTGKTTMVAWLVRALAARGRRPAVVSRGYKGRAGRGPLVVSRGRGPEVAAASSGDEPYLLARDLPEAIVIAGSDRWRGCLAARREGADVVVLDDGFQHLRLGRDLDVVLLDAHSPFGNYRLLPAGSLREPARGLRRADVVLITRSRPGEGFAVIERVVRKYNATVPILRADHRTAGFVDLDGSPVPVPDRAVAFCGIGNPQTFLTDLEAQGVQVHEFRVFRDHHRFTESDWRELRALAERHDAKLLTTEKDLVRLPREARASQGDRIVSMRIEARVHDPETLLERVREALAAGDARAG